MQVENAANRIISSLAIAESGKVIGTLGQIRSVVIIGLFLLVSTSMNSAK